MARTKNRKASVTKRQNYTVGFGKPPVSTRFKKGQSGNPSGRQRQTPGDMLSAAMFRKIPIREGNVMKYRPAIEVAFLNLVTNAAKGDPRSFDAVMRYAQLLKAPMQHIQRSIRLSFVRSTHPRPPNARPRDEVTDEDIDYLNRLYGASSEAERTRIMSEERERKRRRRT